MKARRAFQLLLFAGTISIAVGLGGCATTNSSSGDLAQNAKPSKPVRGHFPSKYRTDRHGNLYIGPNYVENGGLRFYPDHLDTCWLADGFNFHGYDVLYIAPTQSTATIQTYQIPALRALEFHVPQQLVIWLGKKKIFDSIVRDLAEIKPGARVLKMQTTVVKFSGGGMVPPGLDIFLGLDRWPYRYRIYGKMTDGDKTMFEFQAYWVGDPVGAGNLNSMMLDMTDFVAAVAGQYKLR